MKTRQLANVLIKVLGLSIVANTIPAAIGAAMTLYNARGILAFGDLFRTGLFGQVSIAVSFIIGIVFIFASRSIAALFFKTDDDA
jgi:hypothetical protein